MLPHDEEVLDARQAHPDAQAAMEGVARLVAARVTLGWVGTSVLDDRGAFAVVRTDGPLDGIVGEFVRARTVGGQRSARSCKAFVIGRADVDEDICFTRRGFLALGPLWRPTITAAVEVLDA